MSVESTRDRWAAAMFILAEAQYVGVRLTLDADALTMEPADDMAPQWWNGFRTAIEIFEPEIIELMKAHENPSIHRFCRDRRIRKRSAAVPASVGVVLAAEPCAVLLCLAAKSGCAPPWRLRSWRTKWSTRLMGPK